MMTAFGGLREREREKEKKKRERDGEEKERGNEEVSHTQIHQYIYIL